MELRCDKPPVENHLWPRDLAEQGGCSMRVHDGWAFVATSLLKLN